MSIEKLITELQSEVSELNSTVQRLENRDAQYPVAQREIHLVRLNEPLLEGGTADGDLLYSTGSDSNNFESRKTVTVHGSKGFTGYGFGPSTTLGNQIQQVVPTVYSPINDAFYAIGGGAHVVVGVANGDISEGPNGSAVTVTVSHSQTDPGANDGEWELIPTEALTEISVSDTVICIWSGHDADKGTGTGSEDEEGAWYVAKLFDTDDVSLGCGLEREDGDIKVKLSDLLGWGLKEGPGDCNIDMEPISISAPANQGIAIATNEITSDGRPFTNSFEFTFANADVAGCGLQTSMSPTAVALAVDRNDLIGYGLTTDDTPSACGIQLDLGCGLQFNSNQVEVFASDLVDAEGGLITGTGNCDLAVNPGCGIKIESNAVAVDRDDLFQGDSGLEAGSGTCDIKIKIGCGVNIDGSGNLIADRVDLQGVGLTVGSGTCDIDIDTDWLDSYLSANVPDHSHTGDDITELCNWIETNCTFAEGDHTHVEDDITDLQNYALVGHQHVEADITDLQAYLLNITGESIGDLSDVTITVPTLNHLFGFNGSVWINQDAAGWGLAEEDHEHSAIDITSGTFDDTRIAETNVTQHQAALVLNASQIQTGTLVHERGGLEADISAIAKGDILAGDGVGSIGIISAGGASDGDTLTLQADGSVDYETPVLAIGRSITGGTANRILFEDGSNNVAQSINLVFDGSKLGVNTSTPDAGIHLEAGTGTEAFDIGMVIRTGNGSYTTGHGSMLQFENEDVVTAGVRGVREGGWAGGLQFFTHSSSSGNTYGTTFLERMRIDSNGWLGIGGTPGNMVDILVNSASTVGLNVELASTPTANALEINTTGASGGDLFVVESNGYTGIRIAPLAPLHVLGGSTISATPQTWADEAVFEGNTSSTGISILSPNTSACRIAFGDPDHGSRGQITYGHNGDYFAFQTNGSEAMRLDSSGHMGINETSIGGMLHIVCDAAGTVGSIIELASTPTANAFEINTTGTSGGNFLCMNSGGKLGLGKTSPSYMLHLSRGHNNNRVASLNNEGTTNPYVLSLDTSGAANDDNTTWFLLARDSGTDRLKIFSDGDVQNHDNSYGALSDIRIKQDIRDARSQWDDVKNIRVRNFMRKDDVHQYGNKAWEQIGVIAQEVEKISPKLIKHSPPSDFELEHCGFGELIDGKWVARKDENGSPLKVKSMNYSILQMKAFKALQEAMGRIEKLENQIELLSMRN